MRMKIVIIYVWEMLYDLSPSSQLNGTLIIEEVEKSFNK